ncbi:MAG: GNAT family N-acetyltransferase [Desulfobacterales bacterium]
MVVKTRPAKESDAPFLAWVMQAAARSHLPIGMWDLAFPGPDEQRLEKLSALIHTETIHFGHWTRFRVAEVDQKPAAALAAFENSRYGPKNLAPAMLEAFRKMDLPESELMAIPERIAPMTSIKYVYHDGRWNLEWVATRPEYRGRGIINRLLQEIIEEGRRQGFAASQVGYILGNTPAKNAYEKVGFRYVTEYSHPDFENVFGTPGIASMHLDL